MPKEVRRRIFYCLIVVFLLLGTAVVLYAQGWRLGFQPFGLAKVGGIYIRTFPAEARVKIGDKFKERKIGLFEKGTLLNDILPGEYDLEVDHPGFKPFRLPVTVSSSLVTGLQNVVLVPDSASPATSTPVRDIKLAGTTLLIDTASGTQALSGMRISGKAVAGSEDGTIILSYATSTKSYFAADISRVTSTNLGRLAIQAAGETTPSFQSIPGDDSLFLAKGPVGLHLLRTPNGEITRLSTTTASAAAAASGRIIWAAFDQKTNSSLLSAYDIPSQDVNADFEFVPGQVTSLLLSGSGNIFALSKDGSLYSLDFNRSNRVRLASNARGMELSRGSDKLAVLDGQGLRIFFLREEGSDLQFALPDPARAQKVIWYRDDRHLFVQYPDKISFLDLEDLGLENLTMVTTAGRAEYEPNSNILYFLEGDMLQKLQFPNS